MGSKRRLLFNTRAEFCIICVLLLYLFFVANLPFSSYFDDLVAGLLTLPVLIGLLEKKFNKTEIRMLVALGLTCLLGVVSNFLTGIVTNISYILNDVFSFLRIFLVYFGLIALVRGKPKALEALTNRLGFYAKIFIAVAFVFGILNLLGIVRMYSTVRFGLRNYYFYFGNSSQFGIFIGCALALLIFSGKSRTIYEIMALACLVMTFKGMGLIIAAVYFILTFVVHRKIRWWHYLIALSVLAYILQFQITSYILDESAPRAILIYYGFVTAFKYFPIGSGFATYGSNMAAVHYSPLYYSYGFQLRKALTVFDDGYGSMTYLNDAYLGMITGQFGIFGLLLVFYVFVKLGRSIFGRSNIDNKAKYITIACFSCFCGMAIMAGSIKTAGGEMLMAVFALYELMNEASKHSASLPLDSELRKIND